MKWVTLETTISVCGPSGQPIYPTKRGNYWLKYETGSFWHCEEKSVLKHEVLWHRKDRTLSRKSTTSLIHHQNHNGEVIDRSCLFFLLRELVFHFYRLMCADTTKCARFLIRKGIFDWENTLEHLRSHEHSMEYKDATITFSRRCN